MTVIVDSDGLIGMFDEHDVHFRVARETLRILTKGTNRLIYPVTVITETVTLLRIRLKKPELADQITQLLLEGQLLIEPVDEAVLKRAVLLLGEQTGKHNTLFDAIVAVIAQKHKADAIFSFDRFYKKQGFKLAADLTP